MRAIANVVILYAAWFATVYAAANGWPLSAAAASLTAAGINIAMARNPAAEFRLALAVALVGVAFDGFIIATGIAKYASPSPIASLPPLWLVSLWIAFATSLNVSLAWLQRRLGLAAILGAVGGPISYYAGAKLGGMQFEEPLALGLALLTIMWALTLPLVLWLARRG